MPVVQAVGSLPAARRLNRKVAPVSVDMLNLRAEYELIADDVRAAIDAVLSSQRFIGGPAVGQLEARMADLIGVRHAVAVGSGTDALLLALMAVGVGAGDEVITTPFTFFATAGCIHRTGARPVFVDIDPETFNIDPKLVEAAISPRTKAILPVHLFGQCAEMEAIIEIADRRGVAVIEDAAQAVMAERAGRRAGAWGLMGCFSFYPTKNLGGFGEGGLISTNDDAMARRCTALRNHGQTDRYLHEMVGGNFRLDTLQAAILLCRLTQLEGFTHRRRAHARRYDELLEPIEAVTTPAIAPGNVAVYHQYSILCDRRDDLRRSLADKQIGSGVYYPLSLHLQPCFAYLGYQSGDLPVSERVSRRILSLPVHPMLAESQVRKVADAIAAFYSSDGSPVLPAGDRASV